MLTFAQKILAAEQIGTRKEKFDMLGGFSAEEKKLLWETFNPFRVFGIRKYDWPQAFAANDVSYFHFHNLLDLLAKRELTGNAAKDAVTATLGRYTEETATVLARVLNKDLDCGANRNSFEKIYPDLDIPEFSIMLAGKIEEIAEETAASKKTKKVVLTAEILKNKYGLDLNEGVIAEAKYDGNRLFTKVVKGKVEYLSRSGKPSDHCVGLFDEELAKLEVYAGEPIVVDGEVLAGSFQETMNAKGSGNDDAKANLKFFVFDWMTLAEWDALDCSRVQEERSSSLEEAVEYCCLTKVVKSKYRFCYTIEELRAFNLEVLEEGQNDDGTLNGLGEGLIIKHRRGLYEWERSAVVYVDRKKSAVAKPIYWVKWKPVIDLDLVIVGYEMGKGRLSKTIGKLLLEGTDENGTKIKASCGSGLNDKMRAYFLANQAKCLGMIVCIEAQELSLAANATVHSARFPIFIRIRDDK